MALARGLAYPLGEAALLSKNLKPRPIGMEVLSSGVVLLFLATVYALVLLNGSNRFVNYYILTIVAVLLVCFVSMKWEGGWLVAALFFSAVCFQNLFLGAYLNLPKALKRDPILLMVEVKTVLLFAGWGLFLLEALYRMGKTREKVEFGGLFGAGFALLVAYSFVTSDESLFSRASYFRNFLAPLAGWYLGKFAVRKRGDFDRIVGIMLTMGLLLSIFSLVELIYRDIWFDYLQMDVLIEHKGWTAEYTDFLGYGVRRLFTGVGTPINAAFILSVLFLLALYLRRYVLASVFALQVILTFAKAGMLVAIIGGILYFARQQMLKGRSWVRTLAYTVPVVVLLGFLYFGAVGALSGSTEAASFQINSAVGHVLGLVEPIRNFRHTPLGNGLGSSGNLAEIGTMLGKSQIEYSEWSERFSRGAESSFGVLIYQLGVFGLIGFLGWCARRLRELYLAFRKLDSIAPRHGGLALAALGAVVGVLFAALFSEAGFVPQNAGVIFMVGGMVSAVAPMLAKERRAVVGGICPTETAGELNKVMVHARHF